MAGVRPASGQAAARKVALPDPGAPGSETQPRTAGPSRRLRNASLLVFACFALALAFRPIFEAVTQSFRPPARAAATPSERPLAPVDLPVPIPAPAAATPAPPPPTVPAPPGAPIRVFAQFRTWGYGDVIGETVTGATCTLDARFEDGSPIPAKGLNQPRVAGRDGLVAWYFSPPFPGANDNGTYVLTCTRDGLSDKSTQDFDLGST